MSKEIILFSIFFNYIFSKNNCSMYQVCCLSCNKKIINPDIDSNDFCEKNINYNSLENTYSTIEGLKNENIIL